MGAFLSSLLYETAADTPDDPVVSTVVSCPDDECAQSAVDQITLFVRIIHIFACTAQEAESFVDGPFDEQVEIVNLLPFVTEHTHLLVKKEVYENYRGLCRDTAMVVAPKTFNDPNPKVTTAVLIAALSYFSRMGGNLVNVYSRSNMGSAQDQVEQARSILESVLNRTHVDEVFANLDSAPPKITVTSTGFSVGRVHSPGIVNIVTARPTNPESCRGDNPQLAIHVK